jgi:hexosaminidase
MGHRIKFKETLISLFFILSFQLHVISQDLLDYLPLVPKPVNTKLIDGSFVISSQTPIYINGSGLKEDVEFFNDYIEAHYGYRLDISFGNKSKSGAINFSRSRSTTAHPDFYKLHVDPTLIEVEGGSGAGVFYGIQTLIQLLPAGKVKSLSVPGIEINDQPRFDWRGMHLDVSRHFFSIAFIKKYIDFLASYKMNTFHWHLTDDQGWRIEIKKYPKLQEISAFRKGTLKGHLGSTPQIFDSIPYGGFYTQDEIKEVVAYASKRHITIVPEIEMPGHALAALAAYPQYSCTGGPFEVARKWGVFKDVFCPKEETFDFLGDILKEVSKLFPGTYIHVGGDECPKDKWIECSSCQVLMKNKNIKDEHELQSYFMGRIEKILDGLGKKMIGWDEILDGGVVPNATVMSWRGSRGGIEAATKGHDVVMSPTTFCYFDFYQSKYPGEPLAIGGYLPIERVYQFEPVPDVLNEQQAKHILGAQANVWTEYISTPEQVEYMVMPRMAALSEVLWTPLSGKNYDAFTKRLVSHFKYLDFKGINYSKAIFDINEIVYPHSKNGALAIDLSSTFKDGVIHYTINGEEPTLSSPVYKERIVVDQSVAIRAALFDGSILRGKEYSRLFKINLATGKEIILGNPPHEEYSRGGGFTLVNGLKGNLPWMGSDWLGFLGEGLDATIDLGQVLTISKVGIDVLRDENSWIYFPRGLRLLTSEDGLHYTSLIKLDESKLDPDERLINISFEKTKARWLRVMVKNYGTIPQGKPGEGRPAWLLVDEISVD